MAEDELNVIDENIEQEEYTTEYIQLIKRAVYNFIVENIQPVALSGRIISVSFPVI